MPRIGSSVRSRVEKLKAARSTQTLVVKILRFEADGDGVRAVVDRELTMTLPVTSVSKRKPKPLVDTLMTVEERVVERVVRRASGADSDDRDAG